MLHKAYREQSGIHGGMCAGKASTLILFCEHAEQSVMVRRPQLQCLTTAIMATNVAYIHIPAISSTAILKLLRALTTDADRVGFTW
jgi:hypothetical protein